MSRATYVFRDGHVISKKTARMLDLIASTPSKRSRLPSPMIIRDGVDPFFSHADGLMYESKSAYYRTIKERGLRIVEEGEPIAPIEPPKDDVAADLAEAFYKVRDGYKPPPLEHEDDPLD